MLGDDVHVSEVPRHGLGAGLDRIHDREVALDQVRERRLVAFALSFLKGTERRELEVASLLASGMTSAQMQTRWSSPDQRPRSM